MRAMSYNTLFAGFDGDGDARFHAQLAAIREQAPDVLLLQECRGYLDNGARRLYEVEHALGMRGLVAPAPATGQHTAVFYRPPIRPLAFEADNVHFHHAKAMAQLAVPGLDAPLIAISVHLCPNGPQLRSREVGYL